jgi:hypothetical protein
MESNKQPKIVDAILNAVSEKLGREAIVRQVKNTNEWIILDIAFSYFQKADRNRQVGYRSGFSYFIDKGNNKRLMFMMVHTPIMFQFFHDNFDYQIFRDIAIKTDKFKKFPVMCYKIYNSQKIGTFYGGNYENLDNLLTEMDCLEEQLGFAKKLFSKSNSSKAGLGNTFYFDIANGNNNLTIKNIPEIIDISWPLFMWLYPSKPLFTRDATLNRAMKHIYKECEVSKIKDLPATIADEPCEGELQAAHIKPHHLGGNDKVGNGLWLCEKHHKLTEGHLKGARTLEDVNVMYTKKEQTE